LILEGKDSLAERDTKSEFNQLLGNHTHTHKSQTKTTKVDGVLLQTNEKLLVCRYFSGHYVGREREGGKC